MSRTARRVMRMSLLALMCLAGLRPAVPAEAQFFAEDNMNAMEHGPFVSSTISLDPLSPRGILVHKGIAVRVAADPDAIMVFDTDLLRVAGAWTGGFLHWYPARDGLQEWPSPDGFLHFTTGQRPGWSTGGDFSDPRPWRYGPLPEVRGRYRGLYLHEDKVVFSYSVGDGDVLELPGFQRAQGRPVFTRTFSMGPTQESRSLHVLQAPVGKSVTIGRRMQSATTGYLRLSAGDESRLIGFRGLPEGAAWRLVNHHLILDLPALEGPLRFELAVGPVSWGEDVEFMAEYLRQAPPVAEPAEFTHPGRARWQILETEAVAGNEEGPFVVDDLTIPAKNPWNSHLRLSDVDFLSEDRAVVTSLSGDVWLVDGIGTTAGTLRWRRFATGLNQPLGVRVVEGRIYVTGRDQITVLHDRNGNGEADFYENFNNQVMGATNFHAFTMNLETDSQGNFYFAKATPWPHVTQGVPAEMTPHHGVLFRVPADGSRLEIVATGLRNPNGMAIGPDDEIIYADNEGNWIPTSFVQRIRRGGFHGFVPSAHQDRTPRDEDFRKPIVWIPHFVDNSPAKPKFIFHDRWPADLQGHLLVASYGRGTLSLVLMEEVDGEWQGAHLVLPLRFRSGLERARFHRDGHLYIAGLTSWQSVGHGGDWASFHRVRYTGRPLHLPVALNTRAGGLQVRFSEALDPESATDLGSWDLKQWTYPWTSQYGTRGRVYSVNNRGETGPDQVRIRAVRLSEDRKTVFLDIPGLEPGPIDTKMPVLEGMPEQIEASLGLVLAIQYTLKTETGSTLDHVIHKTIHRVPSEPLESVGR
jgi:glucose/arabinose dehydrogenase